MVSLEDEQKYYWYRDCGGTNVSCDLLHIGKGELYGFIEEPDYDIFIKNDLRLIFYGTLDEINEEISTTKAR